MKRQPSNSILTVLSVDLLIQILDRIPDPTDRKTLRLVSRSFLHLESLQRRILKVFRREALPVLLNSYGSLEHLDLSTCPALDDRAIAAVFGGGDRHRRLRSVNLSRASGVGWRGLEALVGSCPWLEKVDLSYCCGVGDREMAALAAARGLRELAVTKCLGVTDVGLARVAVGCVGLERLVVKWCLEISDIGIELLSKKCRDLKVLDISYLKVTNRSLHSISSLEKLEILSMVGCSFIDDEGLGFFRKGNNSLQSIDVSRCDNVSSFGLISVIEGHKCLQKLNAGDCFPELTPLFLSKLSGLTKTLDTLKLDGFQVSASDLRTIGLNCKNLVGIGLSKCRGVTDEGISELVSFCANLKTLDLTCCHLLTDNALSAIANSCKKLRCLQLESCTFITEKGLDQIATHCSNLEEIDLTDCSINDTALKCLSKCSELLELKLGLCSNISNKGLSYIGSSCKKLQLLDLYLCTGIDDDGIAAIAGGCKKLKTLNLCYCTQITDRGLKHLSCLEELSDLELRGLVNITGAGLTAIAIGCKSLVELDLKRCYSVDDVGLWALAHHAENLRQINVSYCPVSDTGLCILLGNLRCLQDAKLVHLTRVSMEGFELALRTCWDRLKKLKLLSGYRCLLSPVLVQMLHARGCRIRWVNKPLVSGR